MRRGRRHSAPAADAGVRFGDDAADVLVDDLRRVRVQRGTTTSEELGTSVEPVQLQVVCRQLWSTLDAGAERIEVDDVAALGRVDDALADFYVQQVRAVAERTGTTERELRTWFDETLISETGFRAQVLQGPGPNGVAVLRELENAHLIRAERRRGTEWYELSHDRLIDPIRTSNAAWREHHLSPLQRESQVWERRGRPDGLLLTGATLAEAETWAEQHPSELLPGDEQFLSASRVERRRAELERRASRRRLTAAAGVGVIALAALAVVTVLLGRTKRAEEHAEKERQAAVQQAEAAQTAQANAAELATQARAGELAFLASIEPDPFAALGLALQAELQPETLIPETAGGLRARGSASRRVATGRASDDRGGSDRAATAVVWRRPPPGHRQLRGRPDLRRPRRGRGLVRGPRIDQQGLVARSVATGVRHGRCAAHHGSHERSCGRRSHRSRGSLRWLACVVARRLACGALLPGWDVLDLGRRRNDR